METTTSQLNLLDVTDTVQYEGCEVASAAFPRRRNLLTQHLSSAIRLQMTPFSAVKIFSSTLARDREFLGERITQWLREHPELTPVETEVTQSSDKEFHCFTVTLFLQGDATKMLQEPAPSPAPRPALAPRAVVPTRR